MKPGTCGEHAFSSTFAQFEQDRRRYEAAREAAGALPDQLPLSQPVPASIRRRDGAEQFWGARLPLGGSASPVRAASPAGASSRLGPSDYDKPGRPADTRPRWTARRRLLPSTSPCTAASPRWCGHRCRLSRFGRWQRLLAYRLGALLWSPPSRSLGACARAPDAADQGQPAPAHRCWRGDLL